MTPHCLAPIVLAVSLGMGSSGGPASYIDGLSSPTRPSWDKGGPREKALACPHRPLSTGVMGCHLCPWKGPGDKTGFSEGIFSVGVDASRIEAWLPRRSPLPSPPKLATFRPTMSKQERVRLAAGLQLVSFVSEVAVTPAENQGAQEPQDLGFRPGRDGPGQPPSSAPAS